MVNYIRFYEKWAKNYDSTFVAFSKVTSFNTDDLNYLLIIRIVFDVAVGKTLTYVFHNAGVDEHGTYREANRQICWA